MLLVYIYSISRTIMLWLLPFTRCQHLWREVCWWELQAEALWSWMAFHGKCWKGHQWISVLHYYCQDTMAGWKARCIWQSASWHGKCIFYDLHVINALAQVQQCCGLCTSLAKAGKTTICKIKLVDLPDSVLSNMELFQALFLVKVSLNVQSAEATALLDLVLF